MPTDGRVPPSPIVVPPAPPLLRLAPAPRASLFCLVEPAFDRALLPVLREHLALDSGVAVLIERRGTRSGRSPGPPRQLRHRAPVAERDVGQIVPPALRPSARHLRLVQPMAPLGPVHQDTELLDLVARTAAMEPAAATEFWWRVSPRVLARLALATSAADEPATVRAMLGRVLDELPGYDPGREPLTGWLDAVVDRFAEDLGMTATARLVPAGPLRSIAAR